MRLPFRYITLGILALLLALGLVLATPTNHQLAQVSTTNSVLVADENDGGAQGGDPAGSAGCATTNGGAQGGDQTNGGAQGGDQTNGGAQGGDQTNGGAQGGDPTNGGAQGGDPTGSAGCPTHTP
jgi:hypothetical protein